MLKRYLHTVLGLLLLGLVSGMALAQDDAPISPPWCASCSVWGSSR